MRSSNVSRAVWRSGWIPGLCAAFGFGVSGAVLLGWIFDVEALRSLWPGGETMKPNTAVAFLAASAALFLRRRAAGAVWVRRAAAGAAALTLAIGGLTLAQYAAEMEWGIDGLLVSGARRMSLSAAVGLTALGVALLGIDHTVRGGRRPTHLLALVAGLVGALAGFGYLYGLQSLHTVAEQRTLSMHSAAVLLALALGVLMSRSGPGALHVLTSAGPGGVFARWLLPVVLLLPAGLDGLRLAAERGGWVSPVTGEATQTLAVMFLLGLLIWRHAARADEADRRSRGLTAALRGQERAAREELEAKVRGRTAELEANMARLRLAVQAANIGVWGWDVGSDMLQWDEGMRGIYAREGEVPVETWREMVLPEDRAETQKAMERAMNGEPVLDHFFRIRRSDGAIRHLQGSALVLKGADGAPVQIIGVNRDITEEREADMALRRQQVELERSNRDLEQFAYVASHDLQEPLRAVSGCVQLLQRRHGDQLDPQARELIGHAVDGARRMQALILDLLTYSRVGTGELNRRRVKLGELLAEALRNLQAVVVESGALVTVEGGLPEVTADGPQLTMLLQNLVGNGLKYAAPGRAPRVQVGARRGEGEWEVWVRDNGVGIERRFFERIFVIFQRLHTRDEYPGTGIGLALCKKIVERHGGRIWVESRPGEGSVFTFTLPDSLSS